MANAYPTTCSVYDQITNRIIEQLQAGVAPWHKPWGSYAGQPTLPRNLISQKPYRGINALLTLVSPYASPFWLTYQQAIKIGGHVNAGEKSTPIVFWKFGKNEVQEPDGSVTDKTWAMCRLYRVFNYEQCTIPGLDLTPSAAPTDKIFNRIAECEQVVAGFAGPAVKHAGDRAFYMPSLDAVTMPARESFDGPEEYYNTLFHELTHSTGHGSRLNREGINQMHFFGDPVYSREELVAEMGAAFLSGHCGIESKTLGNSAAYLQSWIRVLRSDSKLVLVAAGQAQKAADLILGLAAATPTSAE
jgi:antirestriction protein ArdC